MDLLPKRKIYLYQIKWLLNIFVARRMLIRQLIKQ